eukprot:5725541-Pyramimonas_sp.AAC.1
MFMTDESLNKLGALVREFGVAYMKAREECRLRNRLCFKLTPKVHRYQHVPLYCGVLNVRFAQTYGEESLIGTTTKVWHKTMRG